MSIASGRREDLAGRVFGRLTVIGFDRSYRVGNSTRSYWKCACSCGKTVAVRSDGLKCGDNVSCGCKKVDQLTEHGDTGSPEHKAWMAIFDRCRNPNDASFKDYGARGINICVHWEVYENFLFDMGRRPTAKHTIERKNNDKGYDPGNCEWSTRRKQSYNRRSTKISEEKAEQIRRRHAERPALLAAEFGVSRSTISNILNNKAWL